MKTKDGDIEQKMRLMVNDVLNDVLKIVVEQERYSLDVDDSSDEDDYVKPGQLKKINLENESYPFQLQYWSRALLFSPSVQKQYYQEKRRDLYSGKIRVQDKVMRKYIRKSLLFSLQQIFTFRVESISLSSEVIESELTNKLIDDFSRKYLRKLTNYLMRHKHALMRQRRNPEEAALLRESVAELIFDYMENLSNNSIFQGHIFTVSLPFSISNFVYHHTVANRFYQKSKSDIWVVVDCLCRQCGVTSTGMVSLQSKNIGVILRGYLNSNMLLQRETAKILVEAAGKKTRMKLFDKKANEARSFEKLRIFPGKKKDYASIWCRRLIIKELKRGNDSILERVENIVVNSIFDKGYRLKMDVTLELIKQSNLGEIFALASDKFTVILPYNHLRLLQQLKFDRESIYKICSETLEVQLTKHGIELERKTLGDGQYTFRVNSVRDMLVNIRKSNRSQRRNRRNYLEERVKYDRCGPLTVNRAWKFGPPEKSLEYQNISVTGKRSDFVHNMGNYKQVFKNISIIKKERGVNDVAIANYVRQLLNGETFANWRSSHRRILIAFTHLFFGVESARNPSSIITHQMILDLIIAGKLTWEETLVGDNAKMPMEVGGATNGAVILRRRYNRDPNMVHKYKYLADCKTQVDGTIKDRENAVVTEWLKIADPPNIEHHVREVWYKGLLSESEQQDVDSYIKPASN